MTRPPIVASILAALLVGAGVVGSVTGTTASSVPPVHPATAPITSATLVCPAIDGTSPTTTTAVAADLASALTPPSTSTGAVTATVLAAAKSKTSALPLAPTGWIKSRPKANKTVALAATGSVAASLVADQVGLTSAGRFRGLTGAGCVAPATDWWFAGADGRVGYTDALILSDPAPTAAEISISLWGTKGPLSTPTVDALRIRPRSVLRISIASIAPDAPTVAVHVHASSGAVTAALVHRHSSGLHSDGADFMPATAAPARAALVAGYAAGKGPQELVLANPGSLDATVNLRLVTGSGSFAPAGIDQIILRAGHTRAISLARALAGTTGAVELTSDQPVLAQGLSEAISPPNRPDFMWLAATAALAGPAAIANGREPDGGRCLLLLSAPKAAASVRITTPSGQTRTISVPAGRSVSVDITATVHPPTGQPGQLTWPFVVTPQGSAPVYGVRVLEFTGAHGALITAEPLVSLPTAIVLPAVRPDPRIATR